MNQTFEEFYRSKHNFCYMVYPTKDSLAELVKIRDDIRKLSAGSDVGEEVGVDELHTTIRYCTLKPDQQVEPFIDWLDKIQLATMNATVEAIDLFNENSLVLKLYSDELRSWNSKIDLWLETNGYLPSDWKIYRPHISLFYGYVHRPIPKFKQEYRINVKFDTHIVTKDKSINEIFRRKSDRHSVSTSLDVGI